MRKEQKEKHILLDFQKRKQDPLHLLSEIETTLARNSNRKKKRKKNKK